MYRLNTKIRLTMLCLSRFLLYSRWVPLLKQQRQRLRKLHLKSEFASNLNRRLFHLIQFVKFWSCVLKHCIKVQEKKNKAVALCSRPPQNVKLLIFTSKSCRDGKKCTKKRDGLAKLLFCQSKHQDILFFAIVVAVAVVVA